MIHSRRCRRRPRLRAPGTNASRAVAAPATYQVCSSVSSERLPLRLPPAAARATGGSPGAYDRPVRRAGVPFPHQAALQLGGSHRNGRLRGWNRCRRVPRPGQGGSQAQQRSMGSGWTHHDPLAPMKRRIVPRLPVRPFRLGESAGPAWLLLRRAPESGVRCKTFAGGRPGRPPVARRLPQGRT